MDPCGRGRAGDGRQGGVAEAPRAPLRYCHRRWQMQASVEVEVKVGATEVNEAPLREREEIEEIEESIDARAASSAVRQEVETRL